MAITRRELMEGSLKAALAGAAKRFVATDAHPQPVVGKYAPAFAKLDQFIERYMREMNAPGMALSLADAEGVQRVAAYGFSDTEKFSKVEPNQLFEIGSISKSFLAILLLQ